MKMSSQIYLQSAFRAQQLLFIGVLSLLSWNLLVWGEVCVRVDWVLSRFWAKHHPVLASDFLSHSVWKVNKCGGEIHSLTSPTAFLTQANLVACACVCFYNEDCTTPPTPSGRSVRLLQPPAASSLVCEEVLQVLLAAVRLHNQLPVDYKTLACWAIYIYTYTLCNNSYVVSVCVCVCVYNWFQLL